MLLRGALLALAMTGLCALQVAQPWAWSPVDLPLLLAIFAGLQRGRGTGLALGAFGGALLDAWSSPAPGLRLGSLALAGALADALEPDVKGERPTLQAPAAAALTLVHDLVLALLAWRAGLSQGGLGTYLGAYVVPRFIAQGLLAIPFFFAFRALVRQRVFLNPLGEKPKLLRRW